MRILVTAVATALLLAGCISTPDVEIDSVSGDSVVIRTSPFAGMTEAEAKALEACGGRVALMDRATREGDDDNTYFTFRCVDRDWDRLRRATQ